MSHLSKAMVLMAGVVLFSCSSNPTSTYGWVQKTKTEPVKTFEPYPETFDNYKDESSDEFLTRRINRYLERKTLEVEEKRRQEQAELERQRASVEGQPTAHGYTYYPYYPQDPYKRPWTHYVPWNTVLLGGVGAAIGKHNDNTGAGLAVGAGLGLMFDLMRWR